MPKNKDNEIAEKRFELISPLLAPTLSKKDRVKIRMEIAKNANVSEKTIERYFKKLKDSSFDGLKPSRSGRPSSRAISDEILNEAIILRRENPRG
ncbi:MAG: IS481 family transposase, partial [Rickettsiales bacterium]|nr:IS481 family transposase [Rickettsiales bacterium]